MIQGTHPSWPAGRRSPLGASLATCPRLRACPADTPRATRLPLPRRRRRRFRSPPSSSATSSTGPNSPAGSRRSSASSCARASPAWSRPCISARAALVKQGDLLVSIDQAPYLGRVRAGAGAGRWPPRRASRWPPARIERGQQLMASRNVSQQRSRHPLQRAARGAGQSARGRSRPADGAAQSRLHPDPRADQRAASAGSRSPSAISSRPAPLRPLLTTLVSVDPIYAASMPTSAACSTRWPRLPGSDARARAASRSRSRTAT